MMLTSVLRLNPWPIQTLSGHLMERYGILHLITLVALSLLSSLSPMELIHTLRNH